MKEVSHLVGVVGEHVAHRIYCAAIVLDDLRELLFFRIHIFIVQIFLTLRLALPGVCYSEAVVFSIFLLTFLLDAVSPSHPAQPFRNKKMGEGSPEYYEKCITLYIVVYNHLKSSIG